MNIQECLSKIIGLTDTDCSCFIDGYNPPDGYDDSQSGYYLTEGQSGIPLDFVQAAENCDNTLWDILEKSRVSGIRKFLTDLGKSLGSKSKDINNWRGWIGETSTLGKKNASNFVGVRLRPFVAANMEINSIGIRSCCDGDIVVSVYRDDNFVNPVGSYPMTVVANEFTYLELPESLCLSFTDGNDSYCYYVVYKPVEGCEKVAKTKIYSCNCGFSEKKRKHRFLNFVSVDGVAVSTLGGLNDCHYCNTYSNGIQINACLSCDMSGWLCSMDFTKNFDPSSIDYIVAQTIQMAGVMALGEKLLLRPNCSPYSMISTEMLPEHLQRVQDDYYNNIAYLAANVPNDVKICYECDKNITLKSLI